MNATTTRTLAAAACLLAVLPAGAARADDGDGGDLDVLIINLNLSPKSGSCRTITRVLQQLRPGLRVRTEHFPQVTTDRLARWRPRAVVLSPQGDPWWSWDPAQLERMKTLVRGLDVPVLGICGGHQFLALAFGGEVAPIQDRAGAKGYQGLPREQGPTRVQVVRPDPLFTGFRTGSDLRVREAHAEEVKRLPEGFVRLVRGRLSPHQSFRHPTRPMWGVQFHPEAGERGDDGRRILSNFLGILDDSATGAPPAGQAGIEEPPTEPQHFVVPGTDRELWLGMSPDEARRQVPGVLGDDALLQADRLPCRGKGCPLPCRVRLQFRAGGLAEAEFAWTGSPEGPASRLDAFDEAQRKALGLGTCAGDDGGDCSWPLKAIEFRRTARDGRVEWTIRATPQELPSTRSRSSAP